MHPDDRAKDNLGHIALTWTELQQPVKSTQNGRGDTLWFFPGRSEFLAVSDEVESLSDVSRSLHSYCHLILIVAVFIHVVNFRRRTGSTAVSPQVALLCHSLCLTLTHENTVHYVNSKTLITKYVKLYHLLKLKIVNYTQK